MTACFQYPGLVSLSMEVLTPSGCEAKVGGFSVQ